MMIRLLLYLVLIGVTVQRSPPGPSPCQNPLDPLCLEVIKSRFNSESTFWWGTWFDENCPRPKAYCSKPSQLEAGKTLKSAIPGIDESEISKYLTVTYTSEAGKYSACGTEVTREAPVTFSLDPAIEKKYKSWDARFRPMVSWEATESEKYTLMMLDVGVGIVHGVWSNIQGGVLPGHGTDLDSGINVAKMYNGPKNAYFDWPNPYVFLLFNQTQVGDITIDNTDFGNIFYLQTAIPTIMSTYGLQGPVAANWLITEGDMYAVQFFINMGLSNNCPSYISRALSQPDHSERPFLSSDNEMTVFVEINMTNTAIEYTICNKTMNYPGGTYNLDPFSEPILPGAGTRSGADLSVALKKAGFVAAFMGEKYTMLCVDPDVPNPGAGTQAQPILHMMITNIQGGIFTSGDVVQEYQGPRPPDDKPHTYYFLLYKQMEDFTFNMTDVQRDYIRSTTCGRCLFDISAFVAEKQLQLVGATWMKVQNDKFVDYSYVLSGRNESDFCSEECPDGEACGSMGLVAGFAVLTFGLIASKILV